MILYINYLLLILYLKPLQEKPTVVRSTSIKLIQDNLWSN